MFTTTSRTSSTSTFFSTLLTASYFLFTYTTGPRTSTLMTVLLALAGLTLVLICLVVVARTTMVAWITVLVLLAFSGKRRSVLVHDGRKITTDVAMDLFKFMVKEGQFFTAVCAAVVSVLAMAQVTRI